MRDQLTRWRSVPRSLMQFMDAEAFAECERLIQHGSDCELREFLVVQEKLRCLKNIRRSTGRVKRALRSNSREALHTLKREFEQAAILLE